MLGPVKNSLHRSLACAKTGLYNHVQTARTFRKLKTINVSLNSVRIDRGLPAGAERVLVLSPHPDDESIGCGGTLARLAREAAEIDVVLMTSGAAPGDTAMAAQREAEARRAARVLGLTTLHFLGGQDGELHLQHRLYRPIRELLEQNRYQVIFCPWPHDGHSDHTATFRILRRALASCRHSTECWLYEVWSPVLANRLVDIDATIDLKIEAIASHASQHRSMDYAENFRGLARYRSLSYFSREVCYAEAFFVCDGNRLRHLKA